jgi:hypothetical protein
MSPAKTQRVLTWCGIVLLVLGVPGAIFADNSLQRGAQFLAIGTGVVALLMARLFLPWAQRRGQQDRSE